MAAVDQLHDTAWAMGDPARRLKLRVGKGLSSHSQRALLVEALKKCLEGPIRGIRPAV